MATKIELSEVRIELVGRDDHDSLELVRDVLDRYHYLGKSALRGKYVVHVAVYRGEWLGILVWDELFHRQAVRDKAIGWSKEQRNKYLKHVICNRRFLVLSRDSETKNLGSKILSLSVQRIKKDWEQFYGQVIVLLETYVDPERYKGSCYLANGWEVIGHTSGNIKINEVSKERTIGSAKLVFHKKLHPDSYAMLSSSFPHPVLTGTKRYGEGSDNTKVYDVSKLDLQGLNKALAQLDDPRSKHGQRYNFTSVITLCVAAVLAGQTNYKSIHQWINSLGTEVLVRAGLRCGQFPSHSQLTNIIKKVDAEKFDRAVNDWLMTQGQKNLLKHRQKRILAFDGKCLRGSTNEDGKQVHLLSFIIAQLGITVEQRQVSNKTNEIPVAQKVLSEMDINQNDVVIGDALHTQVKTANLIEGQGAIFVLTVKKNQKTLYKNIARFVEQQKKPEPYQEADKGHGRIENRRITVFSVSSAEFQFPYIRQVAQLERERYIIKKDTTSTETVFLITNATPERSSPKDLLHFDREYWSIENKSHHVRDVTFREDLSTIRKGSAPRVMATFRNLAIGIFYLLGANCVADATRHFSFKAQESIQHFLKM